MTIRGAGTIRLKPPVAWTKDESCIACTRNTAYYKVMTFKSSCLMTARYFPLLLSLALSSVASANTDCVNGSLTDPDGDGWGWENDQSCRVADESSVGGDEPTDMSGCDYSNAASNDGWGWNNTSGTSCPPTGNTEGSGQPTGDTAISPNDAMAALLTGGWDCARRFPHYNIAELEVLTLPVLRLLRDTNSRDRHR